MGAKEIMCLLQCLIRNRTQLVLGRATEPMGGVGGQLGPGGVVTMRLPKGRNPCPWGALESDRLKFKSLLLSKCVLG